MARSRKQQKAARNQPAPTAPASADWEGAGMEDLDAAFLDDTPEPAEPVTDEFDLSDPDAKAAWLELLAEAHINNDQEAINRLTAMLPESTEPDPETVEA